MSTVARTGNKQETIVIIIEAITVNGASCTGNETSRANTLILTLSANT